MFRTKTQPGGSLEAPDLASDLASKQSKQSPFKGSLQSLILLLEIKSVVNFASSRVSELELGASYDRRYRL